MSRREAQQAITQQKGIVTLAIFTCQRGDPLIGRTQENQWLGDFHGGVGSFQNPLFLANVTMPSIVIERWLALYRITEDSAQVVRIIDGARDLSAIEWTPE